MSTLFFARLFFSDAHLLPVNNTSEPCWNIVLWFLGGFFCNHCIYLFCFFASLQWPTYLTSALKNRLFSFFGVCKDILPLIESSASPRCRVWTWIAESELRSVWVAPARMSTNPTNWSWHLHVFGSTIAGCSSWNCRVCPQVTGVRKENEASRVWDYREIQDTWGHPVSPGGAWRRGWATVFLREQSLYRKNSLLSFSLIVNYSYAISGPHPSGGTPVHLAVPVRVWFIRHCWQQSHALTYEKLQGKCCCKHHYDGLNAIMCSPGCLSKWKMWIPPGSSHSNLALQHLNILNLQI